MTFVECRILPSLVGVWSCRNCQEVTLWLSSLKQERGDAAARLGGFCSSRSCECVGQLVTRLLGGCPGQEQPGHVPSSSSTCETGIPASRGQAARLSSPRRILRWLWLLRGRTLGLGVLTAGTSPARPCAATCVACHPGRGDGAVSLWVLQFSGCGTRCSCEVSSSPCSCLCQPLWEVSQSSVTAAFPGQSPLSGGRFLARAVGGAGKPKEHTVLALDCPVAAFWQLLPRATALKSHSVDSVSGSLLGVHTSLWAPRASLQIFFFSSLSVQRQVETSVRSKILYLIQAWAHAFRNEPKYKVVQDTYQIMKVEGEDRGQSGADKWPSSSGGAAQEEDWLSGPAWCQPNLNMQY